MSDAALPGGPGCARSWASSPRGCEDPRRRCRRSPGPEPAVVGARRCTAVPGGVPLSRSLLTAALSTPGRGAICAGSSSAAPWLRRFGRLRPLARRPESRRGVLLSATLWLAALLVRHGARPLAAALLRFVHNTAGADRAAPGALAQHPAQRLTHEVVPPLGRRRKSRPADGANDLAYASQQRHTRSVAGDTSVPAGRAAPALNWRDGPRVAAAETADRRGSGGVLALGGRRDCAETDGAEPRGGGPVHP